MWIEEDPVNPMRCLSQRRLNFTHHIIVIIYSFFPSPLLSSILHRLHCFFLRQSFLFAFKISYLLFVVCSRSVKLSSRRLAPSSSYSSRCCSFLSVCFLASFRSLSSSYPPPSSFKTLYLIQKHYHNCNQNIVTRIHFAKLSVPFADTHNFGSRRHILCVVWNTKCFVIE